MQIQTFTLNPFQQHTYVVWEGTEAAIIDAGFYDDREKQSIVRFIENHRLTVKYLLLTHAHLDHIFGVRFLAETYHLTPYLMPQDERLFINLRTQMESLGLSLTEEPFVDFRPISVDFRGCLDDLSISAIPTPGHTPGGCCFLVNNVLFSGDTLFAGTIGRTDLPGGSMTQIIDSINTRLAVLPPETIIYPGHGAPTTLANELKYNPYLQ